MSQDQIKTFNRINLVEQWLFLLELPELNKREANLLLEPPEKVQDQVFEDLVNICNYRYKDNSFFPDFRKIGFEAKKSVKKLEKIFAIDL